jgi:WD40 repeat protein
MNKHLITYLMISLLCAFMSSCQIIRGDDANNSSALNSTSIPEEEVQPISVDVQNNTIHPICIETYLAPIAFMPDNERILVRADSGVQIFNLEKMEEELFIESSSNLNRPAVALSPDGEKLAWALEDNSIQLIRLLDQGVIYTTNVHAGPITKLRFSPDGLSLFSASHDGWVKQLNGEGELINEFQPGGGEVVGIGISPDGNTIATVPFDGPVKLWDTKNDQMVAELGGTGGFDTSDAAFSSDGKYLSADLATGLAVWDITSQTMLWDGINSMAFAFSADENLLAYADISENNDLILSSPDGKQIHKKFSGHQGPVWELIFSPDGQLLASTDGIDLRIWQVEDGELLYIGKSECP